MGGNVSERTEAILIRLHRGAVGSSFVNDRYLRASSRFGLRPTREGASIGFRVSEVPAPVSTEVSPDED
ncbi:MAG: hypothetical protein ACYTFO_01050 [Planctomycetota bacterium]|jgi:hypothetical protein